ncbi:hypothetical protein [uncultured Pseudokineococcus sp.]|uniref:ACT domain-containing protein n=1 Tax=uncultured Pseudokineococcus sp. TaxID=1642928 RepID=UPI002601FC16|nr:hypothetical protein [uncultured Pseudokineococcus sp.]
MLARVRVVVPDRTGSLGVLTSAVGATGADVAGLRVLGSEAGRATDDLLVEVRDEDHLGRLERRLAGTTGVEVTGVRAPALPADGSPELGLVAQVLARPEHAARTLVDGAPAALDVDWAAVVRLDRHGCADGVVAVTDPGPGEEAVRPSAPARVAATTLPRPDGSGTCAGAALLPAGRRRVGVLLVRERGLGLHRSELWRLGALADVLAGPLGRHAEGALA